MFLRMALRLDRPAGDRFRLRFGSVLRSLLHAMTTGPTISVSQARQLAITRQGLAGNHRPNGILDLVRRIGCLQLDPINVVARSHLLVLWSRLGTFDRAELDRLLWKDRALFEYWAHAASIVLTEDYPLHAGMMRTWIRRKS